MSPEPSFIFQGTVVTEGAATLQIVDVDELTAIVRVDRVLRAPEQMEHLAGRQITVKLREPAKAGTVAVFQATGWLYGESMAVIESGARRPPELEPLGVAAAEHPHESAAAADRAAQFRTALKARAADASSIVVGRVTGVAEKETAAEQGRRRPSEHDPRWAVATVEVDEAVKGKAAKTVDVLFASSDDVMWRHAPKLAVGQKAVLMLHKGAAEVPDKRAQAILDPLDVQPADTTELVAKLL